MTDLVTLEAWAAKHGGYGGFDKYGELDADRLCRCTSTLRAEGVSVLVQPSDNGDDGDCIYLNVGAIRERPLTLAALTELSALNGRSAVSDEEDNKLLSAHLGAPVLEGVWLYVYWREVNTSNLVG